MSTVMENGRLLEDSNDLHRVGSNGTGLSDETAVPAGTPYGQLAIVLLVLFCEPITAFMPIPFFAQVNFSTHLILDHRSPSLSCPMKSLSLSQA